MSPHPVWVVTCISHKQEMYTGITQIYGDLHRQCTNTGPPEESLGVSDYSVESMGKLIFHPVGKCSCQTLTLCWDKALALLVPLPM